VAEGRCRYCWPDARLGALNGIVALPGGYVGHPALGRLLLGGFRTATRTFASARVLGSLLVSGVGECEAGAVTRAIVVMRPENGVDDDAREATGVGMVGGLIGTPTLAPSSRLRPRSLGCRTISTATRVGRPPSSAR